jgi:hypothetical protein
MHNKWQQDLVREIRDFTNNDDNDDMIQRCSVEVSDCNRQSLYNQFIRVKDNCRAILEIGVCRNGEESFTHVFLKNKKQDTIYVGVDLNDKTFLNNKENNIYTIQSDSSNYDHIVNLCKSYGVEQFDFIFIDGWHSVNQVLKDWEYTNLLSDRGIVGFHDTAYHYGPNRFVNSLNLEKWNVISNTCPLPDDYGIGFAWKKHNPNFFDPNVEVAVLVSGELRTLDKCIDSINTFILNRIGNYDLFAAVSADQDLPKLNLLKYKKAIVTQQPWLDEKDYNTNNLSIRDKFGPATRPLISGVQAVLRQFWFLKEVNNLKTDAEVRRDKKYKWVIRLRPDTMFFNDIEDLSTLDPNKIYIPKFSNFYGYNDRFAFGGSEAMDVYNNRFHYIDTFPEFHPESMLKYCLDINKIPVERTNSHFFTVRNTGYVYPVLEDRFGDVLT